MTNLSPLQIERLKYQPKLPSSLANGINHLVSKEGSATESVANQEEIKALFKNTYGKPTVTFETSSDSSVSEIRNVGVILSGGQAPGGHNVISGLFDGIKAVNKESRLYGFLMGPGGFVDHNYMELTSEIIDEYRGSGRFGYDPIFYYPPFDKTFAEMNSEEKNSISHRGRALAELLKHKDFFEI